MEQVILLSGVVDGSKLKVFRLPEGVNAGLMVILGCFSSQNLVN